MLNKRLAYLTRVLDDGRVVDVIPLTFGRARLIIFDDLQTQVYLDGW
jgi:hypothetical protein